LFLGIYIPQENITPIWNLNEDADVNPMIEANRIQRRLEVTENKWWVNFIQEYENWLPKKMQKELADKFSRNPDSESEGEELCDFVS